MVGVDVVNVLTHTHTHIHTNAGGAPALTGCVYARGMMVRETQSYWVGHAVDISPNPITAHGPVLDNPEAHGQRR